MPISRFSCNGAAMQQGNLPYKRKPKAYAAHLPASGFIYPEKGLEQHLSDTPQGCRSLCLQHAAQRCFSFAGS